ncbi:MAG: chemotaxis protein CheW, partial [Proteobacteria bacterium]|nr:chemotaxis protein CheW [Pseudomonadota bacterium]
YYHCVSRVVDRRFVFNDEEKAEFLRWMRFYERFCQVQIVAYCLMSNHFHVLVGVPRRPETAPSEPWLLNHVRRCYGKATAMMLEATLNQYRQAGAHDAAQKLLDSWFARMWDVSAYMKTLKQRFTQWFNKHHRRKGTLWEDRFRSVLVEGNDALAVMAAYIDLNPVRAGIVQNPADYRWSSYGAAMGGDKVARAGLREVVRIAERGQEQRMKGLAWLQVYRVKLFGKAEEVRDSDTGRIVRKGTTPEQARAMLAEGGKLHPWEMLRCRLRYMSGGVALGSKAFIESLFNSERWRFAAERKQGAKVMRGGDAVWSGLRILRAPQFDLAP